MRQESFVFYTSWLEAIKPYDEEMQNQIIRMIIDYAVYGIEPDLSGFSAEAHTVYTLVKPLIDANSKRRKGAHLGGRPSKKKTTKETIGFENKKPMDIEKENHRFLEKETIGFENKKPNVNVNVNDNVNVNVNDKEKANAKKKEKRAVFQRPNIEEIESYIKEKNYAHVNAEKFYDFYESKNWMVGKNKMSKWKAAVANWERTEKERLERKRFPNMNTGIIIQDDKDKFKNEKEDW